MKYVVAMGLAFLVFLSSAFDRKQLVGGVRPEGWPEPHYGATANAVTEAGFRLGRRLFYESRLSRDGRMSCGTCHVQSAAFADTAQHRGRRNTMSLCNLAWNTSFMWDGGVNHLEVQPLAPITSHGEMDNTLERVVKTLDTTKGYRSQFYDAFSDSVITGQHVLKAMGQFLVMLQSYNSKYDRYMRGEPGGKLSSRELHGLQLFRTHCSNCHQEPLFTDYSFRNNGLAADNTLKDYGRMTITGNAADSMKFKVPTLRNVAVTAPYMHDGRFGTLREVLDHYSRGIKMSATLAAELRAPSKLTAMDKADIIAFLGSLTDAAFLTNVRFRVYAQ